MVTACVVARMILAAALAVPRFCEAKISVKQIGMSTVCRGRTAICKWLYTHIIFRHNDITCCKPGTEILNYNQHVLSWKPEQCAVKTFPAVSCQTYFGLAHITLTVDSGPCQPITSCVDGHWDAQYWPLPLETSYKSSIEFQVPRERVWSSNGYSSFRCFCKFKLMLDNVRYIATKTLILDDKSPAICGEMMLVH